MRQPFRIGPFLLGVAQDGCVGAESLADLDGHMSETSQPNYGEPMFFAYPPVPQRGIGGDAGAQEGRRLFSAQSFGDPHNIAVIHDDLGGVAAIGGRDAVPLFAVIGEGDMAFAILFQAFLAGRDVRHESTKQPTPTI